MNVIRDMKEIKQYKKSDDCVFLGSGSSINNITDSQWGRILSLDIWTVNNWVYHPFIVPKFYHVESKWYDYEILKRRFNEKKEKYKDVKFIFPDSKKVKLKDGKVVMLHDIVFEGANRFTYNFKQRDVGRTHKRLNADYVMEKILIKSYNMSVTLLFELMYKFGYKNIILFGIDLFNSYYFWTGRPECGEVHHQTNKEHEGKNPKEPHATHRIKEFITDFNERWMKPRGKEIFIGHSDTALNGILRLKEL